MFQNPLVFKGFLLMSTLAKRSTWRKVRDCLAGTAAALPRERRDAVGRHCGNALFYSVFTWFSVNYQNMQSVEKCTLCAVREVAGGVREIMVFHWFYKGFLLIPP